jgi:hypothetical protein
VAADESGEMPDLNRDVTKTAAGKHGGKHWLKRLSVAR